MRRQYTLLLLLSPSIVIKSRVEVLCHINDDFLLNLLLNLCLRFAHQLRYLFLIPSHLCRFFAIHLIELVNSIYHPIQFRTELCDVSFIPRFWSQLILVRGLMHKYRGLSDFIRRIPSFRCQLLV